MCLVRRVFVAGWVDSISKPRLRGCCPWRIPRPVTGQGCGSPPGWAVLFSNAMRDKVRKDKPSMAVKDVARRVPPRRGTHAGPMPPRMCVLWPVLVEAQRGRANR